MPQRRSGRPRRVAATAVELIAWTVVLVAVWVATLTAVGVLELVVAVLVAVPLAVLATATRRVLDAPAELPAGWWRWAVRLPGAVVVDTARLTGATVRAIATRTPLGRERTLRLPDPPTTGPDGRASVGAITISATPASYVADVEDDTLVVHALADEPSALERAVAR
ncbi:MAG: hypothetical protein QOE59_3531 [Actinomycetota bacterium]|jgi:hypothetical protein|nr:hypothetical protein [Actinomycetota bacterium]